MEHMLSSSNTSSHQSLFVNIKAIVLSRVTSNTEINTDNSQSLTNIGTLLASNVAGNVKVDITKTRTGGGVTMIGNHSSMATFMLRAKSDIDVQSTISLTSGENVIIFSPHIVRIATQDNEETVNLCGVAMLGANQMPGTYTGVCEVKITIH